MKTSLVVCAVLLHCALSINGARIFVHMMPWFETPESSGSWGIHWTMANCNPSETVNGQQNIASFYHPIIGAYASGDPTTIDWQLGQMKSAGIAGVFIDWPGTANYSDYPRNKQNAEAIIAGTERAGLEFAIVYEDNNLDLAGVPDKIAQASADVLYLQNNYFNKANYVQVNGAPLLLDFGPQALQNGTQWNAVFSSLSPKPTFLTLWYQSAEGGSSAQGEFSWIYSDYLTGLQNWYANVNVSVKIGGAYPGFQPYYQTGGWPGPTFTIPYGTNTLTQTLDLALANTDIVQIATWNDYGEGTIVEPTVENQYQMVGLIQNSTGVKYTHADFEEVTEIYHLRKQHANNPTKQIELTQQFHNLMHKFD